MSDDENMSLGQMLAMQHTSVSATAMLNSGLSSGQACDVIARSIDEDHLPLNSAHFRAAGLHFLEAVEQLILGLEPDDDSNESLVSLREEIAKCRADLTR